MPSKIDRTGETAINTKGLLMKIVKYNSSHDMVVEFVEDGVRVNRVQYDIFKKGQVRHPKDKDRTGETAINTKGLLMKIVEYNSAIDMVVEFVEDGVRVNRVHYDDFKKGYVCHPKDKVTAENRVGETATNTKGLLMKIVEYNGNKDMVVEFEDGERVSGVAYQDFKKGKVSHPKDKVTADNRVGETATNTKGLLMKIVEYNGNKDMVVEFEDGERVSGVAYKDFKEGYVRHPKDKVTAENRVGETAINTKGRLMKIVEYHSTMNMVVEFVEDRVRVNRVQYDRFKKGYVSHPMDKVTIKNRVGETATASNGQTMTIVEYLNYKHIMVQFPEKGLPPIQTTYRHFQLGKVKNPHFPMRGKGTYKTFQTEYAYTTPSGEVYFYCECQNCGWKKNMKADEAINCHHVCEEKEAENHVKKDR